MIQPKDSLNKKASFEIRINNDLISKDFRVNSIITKKEVNKISRSTIEIFGGDYQKNEFLEIENSTFKVGNEIEIRAGYDQLNVDIFKGLIESISVNLRKGYKKDPNKSFLKIECVDKAVKLTNSYTNDIFVDMTEEDIIKSLISRVGGLSLESIKIETKHDFFSKYNNSDWNFIVERAKINSLLVINSDNKLSLKAPSLNKTSQLTITNSGETYSFSAKQKSENQIKNLTINSFDSFNSKKITKDVSEPPKDLASYARLVSSDLDSFSFDNVTLDLAQDLSIDDVDKIGSSKLCAIRSNRILGKSSFRGVPGLDIDTVVTFDGFGNNFNGDVYVTQVSHAIMNGEITTDISFGVPTALMETDELDKNNELSLISGVHLGKIIDIESDPKNQCRVKVIIPELSKINTNIWDNMSDKGIWAKLSHSYTSKDSGFFFLPEIGTQVIVSFISGNPNQPIVIGSLYSSDNMPYKKFENSNHYKAIVSRNKMMIEFNEEKETLSILTSNGNKIILDDNNSHIGIADCNGNEIKISDNGLLLSSESDIKINSSNKVSIEGKAGVSISSSLDNVDLNGMNITHDAKGAFKAQGAASCEVSASGQTTIKGAMVMIN